MFFAFSVFRGPPPGIAAAPLGHDDRLTLSVDRFVFLPPLIESVSAELEVRHKLSWKNLSQVDVN